MASSGQVLAHRPHCTQFFSMKRSCGRSVLSCKALAGQALTQLRHSVQVSLLTAIVPSSEAPGSAMASIAGRWAALSCSRWSMASSTVARFSA
ncbi:hypothetical protein D9M68_864610 [compost metagenome]